MQFPKRIAAVLLACVTGAIDATGQTFSIDAHVVGAGSVLQSSPCFRLQSTLAEPVAGYSFSTTYSLSAGFQAVLPVANDEVFSSGFEACP
jgi:hypothetical protein